MKKFKTIEELQNILKAENYKKTILATGDFDVLNVCDIRYLRETKKFADVTIVGLYSDEFIKFSKKNLDFPLLSFNDRLQILEGLEMIDYIIQLENDDFTRLFEMLKFDFYLTREEKNSTGSIKTIKFESKKCKNIIEKILEKTKYA